MVSLLWTGAQSDGGGDASQLRAVETRTSKQQWFVGFCIFPSLDGSPGKET